MKRAFAVVLALFLGAAGHTARAQEVTFKFDDVLTVQDREIPYVLDAVLRAITPTRVQIEALLDMRELERKLETETSGELLVEVCGNETTLAQLEIETRDRVVGLTGDVQSRFFECERTGAAGWERGRERDQLNFGFTARATADFQGRCVEFELVELSLMPEQQAIPENDEDLRAVRTLLLEAVNILLRKRPLCPEFPDKLEFLDPIYEAGGPQEIGDGGLGVYGRGSIDVSTGTIIGILKLLQANRVIPGPP